jgi:diadenylate cyclase
MHDGAVVIKGDRLLAAGCFLPVSEQQDIKRSFGSRHRAALGLSETSDAVVLIVSEETGALSLAYESKLYYNLSVSAVKKRLMQLIEDKELTEPDEEFHEAE